MKISIIIATWNAAKTLNRCLDSIVPQLTNETELILVDGGSKDDTNKTIESYGDKIAVHISEPDKGIYDAWNKGVIHAHGDWIMFIGADDRLAQNALVEYLDFINNQNLEYDLISSKRKMVTMDDKDIYEVGSCWTWPHCLKGMPISHPGALHNRKLFKEIGLYDIDLLLRKGRNLRTAFLDIVTIIVSEGGISDSFRAIKEYYIVLKRCSELSSAKAYLLYLNMLIRFSVKTMFRKIGINLHS